MVFLKPASCITGPGQNIELPEGCTLAYEGEIILLFQIYIQEVELTYISRASRDHR